MPVLTVPIVDEKGFAINSENDELVALLCQELDAEKVVHLIEAPGLLKDPDNSYSLLPKLSPLDLETWEEKASGRMKRKLRAISKLFKNNSPKVFIGDGRVDQPICRLLEGDGTVIQR